jgi:hypothetical protein
LEDIKHALEELSTDERDVIATWLQELISAPDRSDRVEEPQPAYAHAQPFMTLDEYMEFEEQSAFRHEYVNGVVYAMSRPSIAHARITRKLLVAFETHLRGSPCEPFASKLRIRSETDEIFYCPDVVVACNRVAAVTVAYPLASGEVQGAAEATPTAQRPSWSNSSDNFKDE